jgi:hypothetical protein
VRKNPYKTLYTLPCSPSRPVEEIRELLRKALSKGARKHENQRKIKEKAVNRWKLRIKFFMRTQSTPDSGSAKLTRTLISSSKGRSTDAVVVMAALSC